MGRTKSENRSAKILLVGHKIPVICLQLLSVSNMDAQFFDPNALPVGRADPSRV
jgi:hypothetical protein